MKEGTDLPIDPPLSRVVLMYQFVFVVSVVLVVVEDLSWTKTELLLMDDLLRFHFQ